MGRRTTRRVWAGGSLTVLTTLLLTVLAMPAWAGDRDRLTVTSGELPEPWSVTVAEHPERYELLLAEVQWLFNRRGDAAEPAPEQLGPGYTLVVALDDAQHQFELYPLAEGGPRVFRPKEQPDERTVREAWFFARLSLPETMREVGIALPGDPDGGAGGGAVATTGTPTAAPDPLAFLTEWRDGVLLAVGVAAAMLAALASVAYLVRRDP